MEADEVSESGSIEDVLKDLWICLSSRLHSLLTTAVANLLKHKDLPHSFRDETERWLKACKQTKVLTASQLQRSYVVVMCCALVSSANHCLLPPLPSDYKGQEGTIDDVCTVRPIDFLRKMFDELTCALHIMVYLKMCVHDKLEFTNTSYFPFRDGEMDKYGFPQMSEMSEQFGFTTHGGIKLKSCPDITPTRGISNYDLHLATWDCDKLLASIYKGDVAKRIYSPEVQRAAKTLFMLRNALFHRNWLHLENYQLLCLDEIDNIRKLMEVVLSSGIDDTERKALDTKGLNLPLEAIRVHSSAIKSLQRTASCFKRWILKKATSKDVFEVGRALLEAVASQDPDPSLSNYLVSVLGSRFTSGVDDPLDLGIESAHVKGVDSSSSAPPSVNLNIPMARVRRYRVDQGRFALKQEFTVPDPFTATHADLLNRCLDDFMDVLFEIFQSDKAKTLRSYLEGYITEKLSDLHGITFGSLPLLAKAKEKTKERSDELIKLCSRDPICMIDALKKGLRFLHNLNTKSKALDSIRTMRNILSHQLYIPLSENLKIDALGAFFTDVMEVVDCLIKDLEFVHSDKSLNIYRRLSYLCQKQTLAAYKSFRGRQHFLESVDSQDRIDEAVLRNIRILGDILEKSNNGTKSTQDLRILQAVAIDLRVEEVKTSAGVSSSSSAKPETVSKPNPLRLSGAVGRNNFFYLLRVDDDDDSSNEDDSGDSSDRSDSKAEVPNISGKKSSK